MPEKCLRPKCIRAAKQRGLCQACRQVKRYRDGDPTEEELEAMIAEQMPTMPTDAHQMPERKPRIGKAGRFTGL